MNTANRHSILCSTSSGNRFPLYAKTVNWLLYNRLRVINEYHMKSCQPVSGITFYQLQNIRQHGYNNYSILNHYLCQIQLIVWLLLWIIPSYINAENSIMPHFFNYLPKVSKRIETNIILDFFRTKQLLQWFYSLLESFKLCQFQPFSLIIFVTESRFWYIKCRQHPYTIYQSQLFNLSRLFRYTCSIASYDMLEYLKCIILQKDTMILYY